MNINKKLPYELNSILHMRHKVGLLYVFTPKVLHHISFHRGLEL